MANIIVTSTANCINVVFNDMAQFTGYKRANFDKTQITFQLHTPMNPAQSTADCVRVFDKYGAPWCVTYESNPNLVEIGGVKYPQLTNGMTAVIIDSVDSVVANSNEELYDLLVALKG